MPLADAAPTGTGLAIVGVILLAFVALAIGLVVLAVVLIVKYTRRRNRPPQVPPMPPEWRPSG